MPAPVTGSSVATSLSSSACSALKPHRFGGLRPQRQIAGRIHQHHAVRRQPVDRRSHQVANRLRLAVGQRAVAQLEHHRGLGRPLLVAKQRIVRQHQMHARRFDVGERADGVFELAFQRALIVHLLVELRSHPVRLVEDLKAQPPALHAALGRGRQARLVQLRGRNQDARAIGRGLKRNLRLGQNLPHLARIVRVQIRHTACASRGAARTRSARRSAPTSSSARNRHPAALRRGHLRPAHPRQSPIARTTGRPFAAFPALPADSFPTVFPWPWFPFLV